MKNQKRRKEKSLKLCTYLFCAAATYKKFIEAIVCVCRLSAICSLPQVKRAHQLLWHRPKSHRLRLRLRHRHRHADMQTFRLRDSQTDRQETALQTHSKQDTHSHTHTLAQLTSQFSAHNARKCQDLPSEDEDKAKTKSQSWEWSWDGALSMESHLILASIVRWLFYYEDVDRAASELSKQWLLLCLFLLL